VDCFTETITAFVRFQALGDPVDDFVPGPGRYCFIGAAIREHDHLVIQKRGENQGYRVRSGVVEPVTRKGRQAARMDGIGDSMLGDQASLHAWNTRTETFGGNNSIEYWSSGAPGGI
jgi:hypothetical protein